MSLIPADGIAVFHASSSRHRTGWVLNDGADFLNALCQTTRKNSPFQAFPWIEDEFIRGVVKDAFSQGFDVVRAQLEILRLKYQNLPEYERRVLFAIDRKTIGFRKFIEKMPTSIFIEGQLEQDGELALNKHNLPILPAVMTDKRNADRALKSLVGKGYISKMLSDEGRFSAGNMYSPAPLSGLIRELLERANDAAHESSDRHSQIDDIFGRIRAETYDECADLLAEADQFHTQEAAKNTANPAKASKKSA